MSADELYKLTVHELRVRARALGVKSPTTKRQKELIDEILKIQSGELEPYTTKMGRPVKAGIKSEILKNARTLCEHGYATIELIEQRERFEDGNKIASINESYIIQCEGIVRVLNGKFYIQNYANGSKYVNISDKFVSEFNLSEGDYIKGEANVIDLNFADLKTVENVNLNDGENINLKNETKVVYVKNDKEIYEYISSDEKINKIVLEIETNKNLSKEIKDKCIILKTNECEDVKVSYNMLEDCKKLVKNLCSKNLPFILYFNNTEYIYSILKVFYNHLKQEEDLNAGQYFKEILSMVSNSQKGKIVLFEKENGQKSSYLDIIIHKYCSFSNNY